jgi:hypothetical protein
MRQYKLIGYEKAKAKNKMYNALIQNKQGKVIKLPFGDNRYENYRDITGLNLYPHLIHNDPNRRRLYKARHKGYLRKGYFSPSYFSYFVLW